jgi:dolichyl-phosphate beta-glucosyltransferase
VRELTRLTAPIRRGEADIVVGSRRVAGAVLPVPQPWHRWLLGSIFTLHARLVLGVRVQDTQCGFKVFRGDLARDLFAGLRCDGYAFDLELLAVAHSRHVRVLEMGVEWHNVPGSSISPLRDGLRMLAATWRIRAMHGRHDPSSKPRGAAERVVATTPERRGGPPA